MLLNAFNISAVTPGTASGHYLKWGRTEWKCDEGYAFKWGDTDGTWIYLNCDLSITDKEEFAIGDADWSSTMTIVAGHNTDLTIGDNECFYGGSRNAFFPANTNIKSIKVVLPTNTGNPLDGNSLTGFNWEGAGVMTLSHEPLDEPIVPGAKSNFALQAWAQPQGGETDVMWDTSGGLYAPIGAYNCHENADEYADRYGYLGEYTERMKAFYDKYVTTYTNLDKTVEWFMFLQADPEKLMAGDRDNPVKLEGYDPAQNIVQYYPESKVYYIDFTEFTGDDKGLYIYVPTRESMQTDQITTGNETHSDVDPFLRSGVRFGLINLSYPEAETRDGSTDRFRFLKYGRATRLNSMPVDMGPGCDYQIWNGISLADNPTPWTGDCNTWNNKLGDNRLLSEYRVWLRRIILEVVNENEGDQEHVYVRFEGSYDMESVTDAQIDNSYYFPEDSNDNHVAEMPNIFIGNRFEWYDRGFARFYANTDEHAKLHGCRDKETVKEKIDFYRMPDFTESYSAETEYGALLTDAEGNSSLINFIDAYDDGSNIRLTEGTGKVGYSYDPVTEKFIISSRNGIPVAEGELITAYSQLEKYSYNSKYGEATRTILKTHERTILYDPYSGNCPTRIFSNITYHFPNAEPNNVPTYRYEAPVTFSLDINAAPAITATPRGRGTGKVNGFYCCDISLAGTEYATEKNNEIEDSSMADDPSEALYPVTRWELRQWDETAGQTVDDAVWVSRYDNEGKSLYKGAPLATYHATNKHGDEEIRNVWITDATKMDEDDPESAREVTIGYEARLYYTLGYISTPITLRAFRQYTAHGNVAAKTRIGALDGDVAGGLNPYMFPSTDAAKEHPGLLKAEGQPDAPQNEFYLVPTSKSATAKAVFNINNGNLNTTEIDTPITDKMIITVNGRSISVAGASGAVSLYSTSGTLLYSGDGHYITVPAAGIYILHAGNRATRVAVR